VNESISVGNACPPTHILGQASQSKDFDPSGLYQKLYKEITNDEGIAIIQTPYVSSIIAPLIDEGLSGLRIHQIHEP
jgi:hypothetical protein